MYFSVFVPEQHWHCLARSGRNIINMASLTRSGRLYASADISLKTSVSAVLSPMKRKRKNVVTPEKTECPPEKKNPDEIQSGTQPNTNEYECITVELFNYNTSCEEAGPPSLMSPDSTFKYSSPSETESEISAEFGGWHTSQQKDVNIDHLKQPVVSSDPVVSNLPPVTVPRYPLVPRNSYGGIRDCLPPEELAKWVKFTSESKLRAEKQTQSTVDLQFASSPRTFTAEQMLRMEQNKVKALEKLRANSQLTQTSAW